MTMADKQKRGPTCAKEEKTTEPSATGGKDEACRCKEASRMKPRELLELMMNDLAFWKKAKK